MNLRTIEIIVSPAGQIVLETKGYSGAGCQDASRLLEQALGQVTAEQKTAAFYQPVATGQEVRQR